MIKYTGEQRTDIWFEQKYRRIGGSTAKQLYVNSDTLLIEMIGQHMEEFELEDEFQNAAMQRGNDLEPMAREYLEQYTGLTFEVPSWLQCDVIPLLGYSPDGLTSDNKVGIEIKCLGRKAHAGILFYNEIPSEHFPQLIHFFTVNPELERLIFISFRPESGKNFIKELTLESILDMGTKAKPVLKTVREWSDYTKEVAMQLNSDIQSKLIQLNEL